MEKIAFAGTFDPITKGHLWVIQEALNIAKKVVVMIAVNPSKNSLFSDVERKKMIELSVEQLEIADKVEVVIIKNEYIAQSAIQYGCYYLIRGIRSSADFDYESLIQKTNVNVLKGAKTLFVMPPKELEFISSSFVKSLIGPVGWHWNIKDFLSDGVYHYWIKKYIAKIVNHYLNENTFTQKVKQSILEMVFLHYSKPDRQYHNLEHIAHCLQELEWVYSNKDNFTGYNLSEKNVEYLILAILFHDIIYNMGDKESSDEELSSLMFESFCEKHVKNLLKREVDIVSNLIKNTSHLAQRRELDALERLMCDIDLAIIAQPYHIYQEYAENVRKEYSQYSDEDFFNGRLKVLNTFENMDSIYTTPYFKHYEERARLNISNEVLKIKSMINSSSDNH